MTHCPPNSIISARGCPHAPLKGHVSSVLPEIFNNFGLNVIRILNHEIINENDLVIKIIRKVIKQDTPLQGGRWAK
jgi:very-short-patch-repair endonuclease